MNIINEAAMAIMISIAGEYAVDNNLKINQDELWCLANNIYFEARAESYAGKQAVANVTDNRLDSKDHPDSYCGVVKEGPHRESWKTAKDKTLDKSERVFYPRKHRCQFSWYCDGEADVIWANYNNGKLIEMNAKAWRDSMQVAIWTMGVGSITIKDNTKGAVYYYAHNLVYPSWAETKQYLGVLGNHTFMK